jgi:hypothetical protein
VRRAVLTLTVGPPVYKAFASSYKTVYKAPPTGFSAFPVDPSHADSRNMSQPYVHRAEIERLDQRPGSTSGLAARVEGRHRAPIRQRRRRERGRVRSNESAFRPRFGCDLHFQAVSRALRSDRRRPT